MRVRDRIRARVRIRVRARRKGKDERGLWNVLQWGTLVTILMKIVQ